MSRNDTLKGVNGAKERHRVILETKNLKKYFRVKSKFLHLNIGWIKAVDNVCLNVISGETLGLVGESGCGKSTLGRTLVGIYRPTGGEIYFQGKRADNLQPRDRIGFCRNVQYLHQDPTSCLDPWWKIGTSIKEPLMVHQRELSKKEMNRKVGEILEAVGLEADYGTRYLHELSGGQQRRVGLARILILNPSVIIFDEPTSGTDVSVQATVLKLIKRIKDEYKLTYVHISHNLAVVRSVSDRIAVMYLGEFVELGEARSICEEPLHPYTRALFAALPQIDFSPDKDRNEYIVTGEPPDPQNPPSGCHFHPRCPMAQDICSITKPVLRDVNIARKVACHMV